MFPLFLSYTNCIHNTPNKEISKKSYAFYVKINNWLFYFMFFRLFRSFIFFRTIFSQIYRFNFFSFYHGMLNHREIEKLIFSRKINLSMLRSFENCLYMLALCIQKYTGNINAKYLQFIRLITIHLLFLDSEFTIALNNKEFHWLFFQKQEIAGGNEGHGR